MHLVLNRVLKRLGGGGPGAQQIARALAEGEGGCHRGKGEDEQGPGAVQRSKIISDT